MKFKYLNFLILSILIMECDLPIFSKITVNNEEYVNTEILDVRKSANVESNKIFQIPFGTKIIVKKDLGNPDWVFIPSINGYASSKFLQREYPIIKKPFNLKRTIYNCRCGSEGYSTFESFSLANNKVEYTYNGYLGYEIESGNSNGTYMLKDSKLLVNIENLIISTCNDVTKKCENIAIKGSQIELLWNEIADGFLTQKQEIELNEKKIHLNKLIAYLFQNLLKNLTIAIHTAEKTI